MLREGKCFMQGHQLKPDCVNAGEDMLRLLWSGLGGGCGGGVEVT